ncbi:hypothetical protein [Microbispora sp. NPDC049125]|uniref:hypothetical protein n=1 Tax=Microbispora sp. NPDC049125 TaxID=3154929 RepID=UPI00346711FB
MRPKRISDFISTTYGIAGDDSAAQAITIVLDEGQPRRVSGPGWDGPAYLVPSDMAVAAIDAALAAPLLRHPGRAVLVAMRGGDIEGVVAPATFVRVYTTYGPASRPEHPGYRRDDDFAIHGQLSPLSPSVAIRCRLCGVTSEHLAYLPGETPCPSCGRVS